MNAQTSTSLTWANGATSRKTPSDTTTITRASRRSSADGGTVERNTPRSAVTTRGILSPSEICRLLVDDNTTAASRPTSAFFFEKTVMLGMIVDGRPIG